MSFRDFASAARSLAGALREHGLGAGDRVAIYMRNSDSYLVALLAIWKAGLVAVPVNAKLHRRELQFILGDAGVRALIHDGHGVAAVAELEEPPELEIGVGTEAGLSFEALVAQQHAQLAQAERAPDDVAWLFYTSGTTGRPKGAAISHRNLQAMAMTTLAEVCDFRPTDRLLHLAPLSHGSGLYAVVALIAGAEQVISPSRASIPRQLWRRSSASGSPCSPSSRRR